VEAKSPETLHCNFIKCLQEGCAIVQFDNAFLSLSKFRQDRPQPGHCIQMLIDSICFFHFVFSVKKTLKVFYLILDILNTTRLQ